MEALVEVIRGGLVESIHYGEVAVCDATGGLRAWAGDPGRVVYWRSSAKPIQALSVVQSGAADQFGFTADELAICCGSHFGSAAHVATVLSILAKLGLEESALQCGTHEPVDTAERNRLIRAGLAPTPAHNNCSGKHAGMLATTMAVEADVSRYLEPSEPAQQMILRNMSVLSAVAPHGILLGTDGCGAPIHGMSLQAMATAFARFMRPDEVPADVRVAAGRCVAAMAAAPVMVNGEGTFTSDLLEVAAARVTLKGGAEGLFVVGLDDGRGVAIRTVDGSHRGHGAAVLRVLRLLGALEPDMAEALAKYECETLRNCRGEAVGEIRAAAFELQTA
jgi:L-asparaginase II